MINLSELLDMFQTPIMSLLCLYSFPCANSVQIRYQISAPTPIFSFSWLLICPFPSFFKTERVKKQILVSEEHLLTGLDELFLYVDMKINTF